MGVGDVAGGNGHGDHGQELAQAHLAKEELGAGALVDFVADGDLEHLRAEGGDEAGDNSQY